jgi:FixJ family two-component response regulator
MNVRQAHKAAEDVDAVSAVLARGEIFIVDDDESVRNALSMLFSLEGYRVSSFTDGSAFLATARVRTPVCVLLDIHIPGRSGLDILKDLNAQSYGAPVFIISGQGDIPMAVDAIKHGALDFIVKPFDADTVVARVQNAIANWFKGNENGGRDGLLSPNFPGRDLLTPREQEVLEQIARGSSNKEAGRLLGISPRTIEVHRARIMEKLGAKNAADLVRIVLSEQRGR